MVPAALRRFRRSVRNIGENFGVLGEQQERISLLSASEFRSGDVLATMGGGVGDSGWEIVTDAEFGGMSSANLVVEDDADEGAPVAVFSGVLTQRRQHTHSMCMARRAVPPAKRDASLCNVLRLRLRSDGNPYVINVQSSTLLEDDLYQGYLPAQAPGRWVTAELPLASLNRTGGGYERELPMSASVDELESIAFALVASETRPFELRVASVDLVQGASGRLETDEFEV